MSLEAALGTLPDRWASKAFGINQSGWIVGWSDVGREEHAVLWKDGQAIDLGTSPDDFSFGNAINDRGQIVLWGDFGDRPFRALLWEDGATSDLGTLPGGDISNAWGINNAGQIAGWSSNGFHNHAVLWQGGAICDLGTLPGDTVSEATGINEPGQIVGWSGNSDGIGRAVLWGETGVIALPTRAGCCRSVATAINDRGQIVGWAQMSDGSSCALLWDDWELFELSALPGEYIGR